MTHVLAFRTNKPADGPYWLNDYDRSVVDLFRRMMPGPFTLHGYSTADIPAASDFTHSLIYDHDVGIVEYSNGTNWYQLFGSSNAALNAISVLTPAADRYIYFTSSTAAALGTITAFARTILDDADAGTVRATIGAEASIAAGTTAQYWRGDKSWQTLNGAAVANTPAGNIAATTVQAAINELDSEKQPIDGTLTAFAAVNWSAGTQVPALTGADTFTLKTVGQAAGNILDKAAGDALYQSLDTDLSAIAALASAADKVPYATGSGTWSLADFTQSGRAIVALSWSAGTQIPALTAAGTAAMKTVGSASGNILDKAAGDALYQPLDSDLTTIAGLTATTNNFIVSVSSAWASRTPTQVKATLAYGTAADKNTGTSGNNVPLLDGANTWSANQTVSGTLTVPSGNKIIVDNTGSQAGQIYVTGDIFTLAADTGSSGIDFKTLFSTAKIRFYPAGGSTLVATINSTGLDVVGESRCDTLRIDTTATAATPTPTHTVPININGTVYRFPCVI